MRVARRVTVLTAALLFGCQVVLGASSDKVDIRTRIQHLYSSDRAVAKEAENDLIGQRVALTHELIEGIEKHQAELREIDDPIRARDILRGIDASVNVLGEMRSVEAVPILAAMIGFPRVIPEDIPAGLHRAWGAYNGSLIMSVRLIETWEDDIGRYSAASALVKIGEPCIPAVIEQLMGYQTIHPCLLVLVGLRGAEGTEALLTQLLEETADEKKKARYAITLEYLRKGMVKVPESNDVSGQ